MQFALQNALQRDKSTKKPHVHAVRLNLLGAAKVQHASMMRYDNKRIKQLVAGNDARI